jgi:adenylate cyclase
VAGRIQVTDAVQQRLRGSFTLEDRGVIVVKGKGEMHTWFLNSRIASGPSERHAAMLESELPAGVDS